MAKHEFGKTRIIPADPAHMYHQLNRYFIPYSVPADAQIPRRVNEGPMMTAVAELHEPGRHRVETVPDNVATIFVTEQVNFNGPAFECVREHDSEMAIGFEYLPV